MARRISLVHSLGEDRQVRPGRRNGQPVSGFATFYIPAAGWAKIPPGELDLAELYGGASGFPNQERSIQPSVEFYIRLGADQYASFVAVNGDTADYFTFGFFGRRF